MGFEKLPPKLKKELENTYHYPGNGLIRSHNKYGSRTCRCFTRTHAIHQSIFEADYCNLLFARVQNKEIKSYETQACFPLYVAGEKITTHRVDFLVLLHSGHQEVYETKGFESSDWKIKRKLFQALHPDIPYITVYEKGGLNNGTNRSKARGWKRSGSMRSYNSKPAACKAGKGIF